MNRRHALRLINGFQLYAAFALPRNHGEHAEAPFFFTAYDCDADALATIFDSTT